MKTFKSFSIIILSIITANSFSQTLLPRKSNAVLQQKISATQLVIQKNSSTGKTSTSRTMDSAIATLSHQYFSLLNTTRKPADVHWSCVLYDQNNRQVASFTDNNNDDYSAGSQSAIINLQTDNSADYGAFVNGGKIHISISSNGNTNWVINTFNLSLDFVNPSFTTKYDWSNIDLSSSKKQADLFLAGHRQSPTTGYDVKANKRS